MPLRIKTVERLNRLALQKRSVSFAHWDGPKPAAFMMSMQARTLLGLLARGLYEYKAKGKKCQA